MQIFGLLFLSAVCGIVASIDYFILYLPYGRPLGPEHFGDILMVAHVFPGPLDWPLEFSALFLLVAGAGSPKDILVLSLDHS